MRAIRVAAGAAAISGIIMFAAPDPAQAACQTMEASHNGTNMFHETGAVGAAINKLLVKVNQLKNENGAKKVRMGRVRTKCGPWFEKYLLPHRHCVARARVCS